MVILSMLEWVVYVLVVRQQSGNIKLSLFIKTWVWFPLKINFSDIGKNIVKNHKDSHGIIRVPQSAPVFVGIGYIFSGCLYILTFFWLENYQSCMNEFNLIKNLFKNFENHQLSYPNLLRLAVIIMNWLMNIN